MGYKSIAVVVTDKGADGPTLRAAAELAWRNEAHLDVHCIGIDAARYEPMSAGTAVAILDYGEAEARTQAAELRNWALTQLPADMVRLSVETVVIPQLAIENLVGRLGRYADLIIATKPYGTGRSPLLVSVLEAQLFGTGVPVLVLPAEEATPGPFKRILCAWNESSESLGTIRAALPILQAADKVDIVMVDPPSHSAERSDPGGSVTVMLARHGVKAEVSILARTLPRVSDVLDRFALDHGCDLIVMGAYGHSRFREAILGGATRDMLNQARLPLFMAH